jgi:hypothetical protein
VGRNLVRGWVGVVGGRSPGNVGRRRTAVGLRALTPNDPNSRPPSKLTL